MKLKYIVTAIGLTFIPLQLQANVITFDAFANGEVISNQVAGVEISADNINSSRDWAAIYSSLSAGGEDTDLEGPSWGNSNITGIDSMSFGNLLIIQESNGFGSADTTGDEGCAAGVCLNPDDEGRRSAGSLIFEFDEAIDSFGFDLFDVEDVEHGNGYVATFFDKSGQSVANIGFGEFASGGLYDVGAIWGDNSVNRISPMDFTGMGVRKVELAFGGSAAVDNVSFSFTTAIPEPFTLPLLTIGLLGLLQASRKQNKVKSVV